MLFLKNEFFEIPKNETGLNWSFTAKWSIFLTKNISNIKEDVIVL